jgi:hypothetical protein
METDNLRNKYTKYHIIEVRVILENIEDRGQHFIHALHISYARIQLSKYHQDSL